MTNRTTTDLYLTVAEAKKLIRKRIKGDTYFVRCAALCLYTEVPSDGVAGRGYTGIGGGLRVTQEQAYQAIEQMLPKTFEDNGARLHLSLHEEEGWNRYIHIG